MKKQAAQSATGARKIRLELSHAQAKEVYIAGTFNEWQTKRMPLSRIGNGKWAIDLSLPPGRYEYRFIVNGEWINDPQAKDTAPNSYGSQNAVLTV